MEFTQKMAKGIFQAIQSIQRYEISIVRRDGIILVSSSFPAGEFDSETYKELELLDQAPGETTENISTGICPLYDKQKLLGAVKLLGPNQGDSTAIKTLSAITKLAWENELFRHKNSAMAHPTGGALSVLVGVHPLDSEPLLRDLKELGFDISLPHTTLFIQLSKIEEIQVDAGRRELIMDERQVQYSVVKFLDFLVSYFSDHQDFVMTDPVSRNSLVLYGGRNEGEDDNALRLYHICEYLQSVAKRTYCLSMRAVIGVRCCRLADYERQYEQLVKRLNSGRMLFPEKEIFWGHSILLGSLIFHLSVDNRKRLSSVLDQLLESNQSDILLETLHTFFECNMNQKKTAEKLFIHRNSLLYRLKRIEELTCTNLDDIDSLLSLRLALLCHSSLMIEEEK